MVERLYDALLRRQTAWREALTPVLRRLLRFLALPWLYATAIPWSDGGPGRLQAVGDLLHVFFRLGYFPDNYGPCRLWEKPRGEWVLYYGSGYNPRARARLRRSVQPRHLEAVFEDKHVAALLVQGADLPQPTFYGTVAPGVDYVRSIEAVMAAHGETALMIKPVGGAMGRGVGRVERRGDGLWVRVGDESARPLSERRPASRELLQGVVESDAAIARLAPGALSTIRVVTMLARGGDVVLLGATMRCGRRDSVVDNWSAGGIAVGVDDATGALAADGFDKRGRRYAEHPDTGVPFHGTVIPRWDEVRDLAVRTQAAFPFFRLFGVDVAVGAAGPVIIEINALPDLVFQEQTSGPLLGREDVLEAFAADDLLFSGPQRRLLADSRARSQPS